MMEDDRPVQEPPCPATLETGKHEWSSLCYTNHGNARISIPHCMHCNWVDTEAIIKDVLEKFAHGKEALSSVAVPREECERICDENRSLKIHLKERENQLRLANIDAVNLEAEINSICSEKPCEKCGCGVSGVCYGCVAKKEHENFLAIHRDNLHLVHRLAGLMEVVEKMADALRQFTHVVSVEPDEKVAFGRVVDSGIHAREALAAFEEWEGKKLA